MDLLRTRYGQLRRGRGLERVEAALAVLDLPEAAFKTCPWQPRELIETGLKQWLRCCAVALGDRRMIGMPSRAVDEAWHGFILCTAMYSTFCDKAYGTYLHHHPEGAAPLGTPGATDSIGEQLGRTVVAWSLVARPEERCVLWDLDTRAAVEYPWGIDQARVTAIETAVANLSIGQGNALQRNESLVRV
ncbi:hypothetical protein [Mycobacterium sp. EPa45]|uniref:hypothetical protein n=1 Tax=Mycobacterium sp. EPa45 TaxID=1545728 RepID=UPI0006418E17|nr:hypothetical protein [Mycobacterium sp. EPa45]AKK29772.1 hypothetical protein AB431_27280 [Mycobacterium sp. EPa45]